MWFSEEDLEDTSVFFTIFKLQMSSFKIKSGYSPGKYPKIILRHFISIQVEIKQFSEYYIVVLLMLQSMLFNR